MHQQLQLLFTIILKEVNRLISAVNVKKEHYFDGKIIKKLPLIVVRLMTIIFNTVLTINCFPIQLNVIQVRGLLFLLRV